MRMLQAVKPPASAGHERLRAALAARPGYAQAIIDAEAKLERLQAVLDGVDAAARKAKAAKVEAEAARRAWAKTGTLADATSHHALAAAADDAERAAKHAAADAEAVERELPNAQYAVRQANANLQGCNEDIRAAYGLILAEEETSFLAEGARIAAQLRAWRVRAKALRSVLDGEMFGRVNIGVFNREASSAVCAALDGAAIADWDWELANSPEYHDTMSRYVEQWRMRAAQLKAE